MQDLEYIDRSAIIIGFRQPFLDWLNNLPESEPLTLDEVNEDLEVYLVPEFETPEQAEEILRENFITIFENELSMWYEDMSLWPQTTDFELFKKWFTVKFHSMVIDTVEFDEEEDD